MSGQIRAQLHNGIFYNSYKWDGTPSLLIWKHLENILREKFKVYCGVIKHYHFVKKKKI